jgi:hypothetical protein
MAGIEAPRIVAGIEAPSGGRPIGCSAALYGFELQSITECPLRVSSACSPFRRWGLPSALDQVLNAKALMAVWMGLFNVMLIWFMYTCIL